MGGDCSSASPWQEHTDMGQLSTVVAVGLAAFAMLVFLRLLAGFRCDQLACYERALEANRLRAERVQKTAEAAAARRDELTEG